MSARRLDLNGPRRQGNVTIERKAHPKTGYAIVSVLLHGNEIMTIHYSPKGHYFSMTDCGWQTVTTKTALNKALNQIRPDMGIFQKRGQWIVTFAGGEEQAYFEACKNKNYGFGRE
jgi:hypothetical protein